MNRLNKATPTYETLGMDQYQFNLIKYFDILYLRLSNTCGHDVKRRNLHFCYFVNSVMSNLIQNIQKSTAMKLSIMYFKELLVRISTQ